VRNVTCQRLPKLCWLTRLAATVFRIARGRLVTRSLVSYLSQLLPLGLCAVRMMLPPLQDHQNDAANANANMNAGPPMDGHPLQQNSNESSDSSGNSKQDNNNGSSQKKTPTLTERRKALWAKTGITYPRFKLMFKGALAPTIAITLFQADDFASHFTTVGYLIGITSILSLSIQPRSKFLQTMLVNVVFVCFAAACVTLALYCCVQARIHSGESGRPSNGGAGTSGLAASGAQTAPYNSSAAVVAGIWLMVMIYCMSTVRAAKPQFMIPAMAGAIIGNVGMVYAPQFSSRWVVLLVALLVFFLKSADFFAVCIFPCPYSVQCRRLEARCVV